MAYRVRVGVRKLLERGLFHIFGANVVNKVIGFGTNILIVRFLSQEGYGVFSYAFSIYSIATLFTGFGLVSGMLQYGAEKRPEDEKLSFYKYGLTRGLAIDAVIAVILFAVGVLVPLPIDQAGPYVAMLGPLILFDYVFQYAQAVMRAKKENKIFAYLTNVNSVSYSLFGCAGAWLGGVAGTILGRYLAFTASALFAFIALHKRDFNLRGAESLSKAQKKELWHYSISTGASSVMNQLTYMLDVVLVGNVLAQATVLAEYRVATQLPEGLLFIPSSVVVFVAPYFVEHNQDMEWYSKNVRRVYLAIEALMAPVVLILILFAEPIITLLWGAEYLPALVPFRIMATSLMISPLRTVCANFLAALRETRANLIVSILTLVANVILTVVLTIAYGTVGASLAVTLVSAVTSISAALFLASKISQRLSLQTNLDKES